MFLFLLKIMNSCQEATVVATIHACPADAHLSRTVRNASSLVVERWTKFSAASYVD